MKNFTIVQELTFSSEESTTATLVISIGDISGTITFTHSEDKGIEYDEDSTLKTLRSAGMKMDYQEQIDLYDTMVENQEEILKALWVEKLKKQYADWSVLKLELPKIEGLTFGIQTEEQFINANKNSNRRYSASHSDLTLIYKDQSQSIRIEDVSGYRNYSKNFKWVLSGSITDYKRRNYAKLETVCKKYVELVDEKFSSEIRKTESEAKAKAERQLKLKNLNSIFDNEVILKREYKSPYGGRGQGYYVNRYYLIANDKKEIAISEGKDGNYHFGGLGQRSVETINVICDFL